MKDRERGRGGFQKIPKYPLLKSSFLSCEIFRGWEVTHKCDGKCLFIRSHVVRLCIALSRMFGDEDHNGMRTILSKSNVEEKKDE